MKRTALKRSTKPMKRTAFKRSLKQLKRTKLNVVGHTDSAYDKREIQRLVRLIVTVRDGGCILRNYRCGNTAHVENDKVISETVIQADHLVTRANSATYADTRLIVCLCKGCHGWKHWNEKEYEALVKRIISPDRIKLWDRAEQDHQAHKTYKADWKLQIVGLKQEYTALPTTL